MLEVVILSVSYVDDVARKLPELVIERVLPAVMLLRGEVDAAAESDRVVETEPVLVATDREPVADGKGDVV